jgi:hypothetical protein
MYPACEQCLDLWRRYGLATSVHIQLENKLRLAALQNDVDLIESLTRETEGAEEIRFDLRQSIREHERTHRISASSHTKLAF